jgi:transcriptional regulator with XRE-family HTH domain
VLKPSSIPFPAAQALRRLGHDFALARRKHGISTSDMASRLFVSRDTLWRLERGDPTVARGGFVTAAFVLNLHNRVAASDDTNHDCFEAALAERFGLNGLESKKIL